MNIPDSVTSPQAAHPETGWQGKAGSVPSGGPAARAAALGSHLLPGSLCIMPACCKRDVGHREGGVLETFN